MPNLNIDHVVKGDLVSGAECTYGQLITPRIDLDALVWSRREPLPAADVSLDEIIDLLVEVGLRLDPDTNAWLREAMEWSSQFGSLSPRLVEQSYRGLPGLFSRESLRFQIETELGWGAASSWTDITDPSDRTHGIRAFPPRLVHVVAGNTPGTAAVTIVRGALTRGVNLMKLGADDPLTASAILRTMAEVAPGHPVLRSFSAVYWKGGDRSIENALFRPQYFDKLVAWGGEAAIRNALTYIGPGFELVAFDPKVSISLLGSEALGSQRSQKESAVAAAIDISLYNQGACASSRFVYAEGSRQDLREWCETLAAELGVDRPLADGSGVPVPDDVRDEVEGLKFLPDDYEIFGAFDTGVVVLSDEPVDFHPDGKVVNVVAVPSLDDALNYVTVATQTIGIYPGSRGPKMRDALASCGMQRLVALGEVATKVPGIPHDGFFPLHRLVRWLVDDSQAG
jgi:hypothetical protein